MRSPSSMTAKQQDFWSDPPGIFIIGLSSTIQSGNPFRQKPPVVLSVVTPWPAQVSQASQLPKRHWQDLQHYQGFSCDGLIGTCPPLQFLSLNDYSPLQQSRQWTEKEKRLIIFTKKHMEQITSLQLPKRKDFCAHPQFCTPLAKGELSLVHLAIITRHTNKVILLFQISPRMPQI